METFNNHLCYVILFENHQHGGTHGMTNRLRGYTRQKRLGNTVVQYVTSYKYARFPATTQRLFNLLLKKYVFNLTCDYLPLKWRRLKIWIPICVIAFSGDLYIIDYYYVLLSRYFLWDTGTVDSALSIMYQYLIWMAGLKLFSRRCSSGEKSSESRIQNQFFHGKCGRLCTNSAEILAGCSNRNVTVF